MSIKAAAPAPSKLDDAWNRKGWFILSVKRKLKNIFVISKGLALKWPENIWSLLLQCVITGKAQNAYAASIEQSAEYKIIRAATVH